MHPQDEGVHAEKALKIGIGAPLSGMGSALGREMANAIRMAIDERNAAGGVEGSLIQAVICDDRGEEEVGVEIADQFIRDPAVVAVIGHYNSNVTLRVAPLYASGGLPLVSPIVSNPALTESGLSNIFRFTNRDDQTAHALASHLIHQLGKRAAVTIQSNTVYGKSMTSQFARMFQRLGGAVLRSLTVEEGDQEFGPVVADLDHAADLVFYGGTFEGAGLLREMRATGDLRLFATGDGCWDIGNFVEPAGAAAEEGEGVLVFSACPQLGDVKGSSQFAARYEQRFGRVKNYAVNSFDAAMTLIDALRSAALPRGRAEVAQSLKQVTRHGIAYHHPTSWDTKGDNGAACTALHVVEVGRFRQVALIRKSPL